MLDICALRVGVDLLVGETGKGGGERCGSTVWIPGEWCCLEAMHANLADPSTLKLWMERRGALCLPGNENHLYG